MFYFLNIMTQQVTLLFKGGFQSKHSCQFSQQGRRYGGTYQRFKPLQMEGMCCHSNNLNKAEMNQINSVSTTCLYICRWKTCVFISQLTYSQSKSRENSYNTIKPAYAFTDIEQSPVFKGNIFLSCHRQIHKNLTPC